MTRRGLALACALAAAAAALPALAAPVNVALAANGGVATASSTIAVPGANFGVAAVNDGSHTGAWGQGGGWNDATANAYPDWVQVRFAGPKTIDRVVLTTLQDDFAAPVEPTDTTTFGKYGVTAFQVQTWSGSAWVTRATIAANTRVKRTATFAPVTTDRIRVLVTAALASYARIVEIEAWTIAGPAPTTTVVSSSLNPSTWPLPVVLTATVNGTSPTGTVVLYEGGQSLCGGSLVGGQYACTIVNFGAGAHTIVAEYLGDAQNAASTSAPLVQTVELADAKPNVALFAYGAVATASSTYAAAGTDFGVVAVHDGQRTAWQWGQGWGGGWNDATANAYPDWVQIAFAGLRTIDKVVVVTLADDFASATQPTDVTTFTRYGVTSFDVQTWNGASWVTQGSVAGNDKVIRTVTFAPVTTDRIRVVVKGALASYSRIVEIEAYATGPLQPSVTVASAPNPSMQGQPVTFTATVRDGGTEGTVDFLATGYLNCFKVPVVASRATCTGVPPVGANDVSVVYYGGSTIATSPTHVHQVDAAPSTVNVALAANGGVATASSTIAVPGANFGVAAVNDGSHTGAWGQGGGWNDATANAYPDWVQVRFAGPKTIDRVVLTTLQDDFAAPVEPDDALAFTRYGITEFRIQAWTGTAWQTVWTVTGNDKVKRTSIFTAVTTDRIRVMVDRSLAAHARIVEIEAWTFGSPSLAAQAAAAPVPKAPVAATPIPGLGLAGLAGLAALLAALGARATRRRP